MACIPVAFAVIAFAGVCSAATDTAAKEAEPPQVAHGPSSSAFPSHHFQLAPHTAERAQIGINFGLSQLLLGGFNFAGELRYGRMWFEYSTGLALDLNDSPNLAMTPKERDADLHITVPYTTGFGVGVTLLDELWLGVEFKAHRFLVRPPDGARLGYETYSIGPVLGYKLFVWRGLHMNFYARYWPNVASSLDDGKVVLQGSNGPVEHDAHGFNLFANASIGYAVDL